MASSRKGSEEPVESSVTKNPFAAGYVGLALAVIVLVVAYLLVFYRAPLDGTSTSKLTGELVQRNEYLLRLMRHPSQFASWWTGGSIARVHITDRVPILLAAGAILWSAYAVGHLLILSVQADDGLNRLEVFVFSTGVGLNVLSLLTLAVGLAGGLRNPIWLVLPMVVSVGAVTWRWWQRWRNSESQPESTSTSSSNACWRLLAKLTSDLRRRPSTLPAVLLWLASPFVVLVLLGGMLPPSHFDVREYHLQVPKEWYQLGEIGFLEHNIYGNMPLGAEMHALLGMVIMPGQLNWWWGALVGKTVIAAIAPLTMLSLYALGCRFFSPLAGAVAGLIYVSIPWIARVSMSGLIEGVLGFYLVLSLYAFLLWWRNDGIDNRSNLKEFDAAEKSTGRLLLAGFLAGSAAACKYPGLLYVVAPLLVGVMACRPGWKSVAACVLAVLCGCGLWLGKNMVQAGNPTYPLLYEVFDGRTRTAEKNDQWVQAHAVPEDDAGNRYSIAQLVSAAKTIGLTGQHISPLVLPLALLSLLVRQHSRLVLVIIGCGFYVLAMWWLFTHRIERFWVPVLPVMSLLAGIGATWNTSKLWRYTLLVVVAGGCVGNLLMIGSTSIGDVRFFVGLEQLRRDDFINDPVPPRIKPAYTFLNDNVPHGMTALMIGDVQPFDLEVDVLYNTCFDDCILEKLMKGKNRQQRLAALGERRIAYVYVNWEELTRYRAAGNYGYAAGSDFVQPSLFDELVSQVVLEPPLQSTIGQDSSGNPRRQIFPVANANL